MTEDQIKAIRLGKVTGFQRWAGPEEKPLGYSVDGLPDRISAKVYRLIGHVARWSFQIPQHPQYGAPGPFPDEETALEGLRDWLRKNRPDY